MVKKTLINQIKKELLSEKERIEAELKKFTHPDEYVGDNYEATFPEYGAKNDDNAQEVSAFSSNLALEKRLEFSLDATQKALDKIKKGKFGICELCENEIDAARLKAFPAATTCKDCIKKDND